MEGPQWSTQEPVSAPCSAASLCFKTIRLRWGDNECYCFFTLAQKLWPKAALGPSPRSPVSFTSEGLTSFWHQLGRLTCPGSMPHPQGVRAGGHNGEKRWSSQKKGACHKITVLSLAGQPPSSTRREKAGPEMGSDLHRAAQPRTEAGSLRGSGPAVCTASSPQGSGAGRRERQLGANGLFCSVSCNRAPARLSDTRGSAHSSSRTALGCDSHSCAKRAGPGAPFSAREAPLRAAGGGQWAGKAYFWNFCLAGGPVEARGFAGGPEGKAENPGSGFCLRMQAGPLQAPLRVSLNSFCLHGNNQPSLPAAFHVL